MSLAPRVEMRRISRRFGGVQALDSVDLQVQAGEVRGLLGENGAGKSTLLKILTGVIDPDEGEILIDGQRQHLADTTVALRLGIAAMYQDPTVFPDLTVAENIFAGRRPRGRLGRVDWTTMQREAGEAMASIGVDFGPTTPVRGLSTADRQMIEIAKALSINARVLVMDEPSAALTPREVDALFSTVRRLRDRGVAIVFVSHRLEEVMDIADSVTILRDGRHVITDRKENLTKMDIVRHMVGRTLDQLFPKQQTVIGDVLLDVRNLERRGTFSGISFTVRRGEIVGMAGFVGAGRSEVARSLFGVDPCDGGEVHINGRPFKPSSPRAALEHGLVYLPEDRIRLGLIQSMPVGSNITLAVLPSLSPNGILNSRLEHNLASRYIELLRIKTPTLMPAMSSLSGGNQQKALLAKWLAAEPSVLMLDEPTHGVDVATKADVHRTLSQLAAQGMGILLISSELPEVLGMSDRVYVMREGQVVAEFSRAEATQERIIQAAAGVRDDRKGAQ